MKCDAKFFPNSSLFRFSPKLEFRGKGSVQLQEIGMIAEGDMPRFTLPLIGIFYSLLFNAKTSRTIPYSRVVKYRYSGNWFHWSFGKIFLSLVLIGGAIGVSYFFGDSLRNANEAGTAWVVVGGLWFLIAIIVLILLFKDRRMYSISYRLPDGKKQRVRFVLKRIGLQQNSDFRRILDSYCTETSAKKI